MKRSIASAAVLLPSLYSGAAAQGPIIPDHPHYFWGGGYFLGPLMMILFIAVVVGIVVLVVRAFGGASHHRTAAQGKSPEDILRERFARGEIDKDEFEERRRTLSE